MVGSGLCEREGTLMTRKPDRSLARHLQAAIVSGQSAPQAKIEGQGRVQSLAAHVQAAIAPVTQSKSGQPADTASQLAPHVQVAISAGQGGLQAKIAPLSLPPAEPRSVVVQRAEEDKPPTRVFHATTKEGAAAIQETGLEPRDKGIKAGQAAVCVSPKRFGANTLNQVASDVLLIIELADVKGAKWWKVSDNEWRTDSKIAPEVIKWVPALRSKRKDPPRPLADYSEAECRKWRQG